MTSAAIGTQQLCRSRRDAQTPRHAEVQISALPGVAAVDPQPGLNLVARGEGLEDAAAWATQLLGQGEEGRGSSTLIVDS